MLEYQAASLTYLIFFKIKLFSKTKKSKRNSEKTDWNDFSAVKDSFVCLKTSSQKRTELENKRVCGGVME